MECDRDPRRADREIVALIVVWQWPVRLARIGAVLLVSQIQDLYALSIPVEFALTGAGMRTRHGQRTAMPWIRRVRPERRRR